MIHFKTTAGDFTNIQDQAEAVTEDQVAAKEATADRQAVAKGATADRQDVVDHQTATPQAR